MNKTLFVTVPIIIVAIGIVLLTQSGADSNKVDQSSDANRQPVFDITHGHGLALTADSKLYIATHQGLLVLEHDKDLYQVGDKEDDYMGFSSHPADPQTFFSSGHSSASGNMGFQKSDDAGLTWQKISNGLNGPVDFHAMTVSPANPDLVYGFYHGAVHRSTDGGKTWQQFPVNFGILNFAANPSDENTVYAASPKGLYLSQDKGESWQPLPGPGSGFVSVIAIDPRNSLTLLAYSEGMGGLANSNDKGITWKDLGQNFSGEVPLYITFNKDIPETGYIMTEKNSIYKTVDNGVSWIKIS